MNSAIEEPKQEFGKGFLELAQGGAGPSRSTNRSPQEGRNSNALQALGHSDGYCHNGHEALRKQTEKNSKIFIFNVDLISAGVAARHSLKSLKSGT